MARYSIVIPIYNKADLIEKTVNSVQKQESTDWEIIAVDDESSDNSLDIMNRLASEDRRIKVYSIKNQGVSNARNVGLKNASGDYVMFLDGDDYLHDGILAEYDRIIAQTDTDVIFTSFDMVDENGNITHVVSHDVEEGICGTDKFFAMIPEKQAFTGFFGFITNKLVKRSIIADNGIEFDTSLILAEDLDFYIRVYRKVSSVYFLNKKSFNYLHYAQNTSKTMIVDYYSQIIIQLRLKTLLREKGVELKKGDITDRQITHYASCYIINQLPDTYSEFYAKQKRLYENDDAMSSLTAKELPLFKKVLIVLAKKKMCRTQYTILSFKRFVRSLVRG